MTYDVIRPAAISPPIEAVLTIWPEPRRTMSGYAAATPCTTPRMFTSMIAFHWSSVRSSVSPPNVMPALLKSRSGCTSSTTRLDGSRVGDVQRDRPGADRVGDVGGRGDVEVRADDLRARRGERPGQAGADAGPATRDDRGLSREVAHFAHASCQPSTSAAGRDAGPT